MGRRGGSKCPVATIENSSGLEDKRIDTGAAQKATFAVRALQGTDDVLEGNAEYAAETRSLVNGKEGVFRENTREAINTETHPLSLRLIAAFRRRLPHSNVGERLGTI
jgi:hypothetical protein